MKEIKEDIKSLKTDVGLLLQIEIQLKTVQGEVTGIQQNLSSNETKITTLETKIDQLLSKNRELEHKLQQFEEGKTSVNTLNTQESLGDQIRRQAKKKQLTIEGIAEDQITPLEALVRQVFFDTGVKVHEHDIDQIYRIGTRSKNKPRAVIVSLVKQSTRDNLGGMWPF